MSSKSTIRTGFLATRILKRDLTILQIPTVTSTTSTTAAETGHPRSESIPQAVVSGTGMYELLHHSYEGCATNEFSEPTFTTVGTPPSALSISIPPSLPIYVKRGSLMSLYGNGKASITDQVTSQLEIQNPFKSILYGGISSTYLKITSTVSMRALLSAFEERKLSSLFYSQLESQKSLVNIVLDGRLDWVVVPPKALQAYAGTSLAIRQHAFPRNSGLFGWLHAGYSIISGRGLVCLVGNGQVFRITLAEEEQLLLKRESILALSVNGVVDLSNGSVSAKQLSKTIEQKEVVEEPETIVNPDKVQNENKYLTMLKTASSWTVEQSKRLFGFATQTLDDFIVGNGGFVQVKGPRMILLQTGSGRDKFQLGGDAESSIKDVEEFITEKGQFLQPEKTAADYLKYATVKDGKVEFKSTPDFSKTVKEIRGNKDE